MELSADWAGRPREQAQKRIIARFKTPGRPNLKNVKIKIKSKRGRWFCKIGSNFRSYQAARQRLAPASVCFSRAAKVGEGCGEIPRNFCSSVRSATVGMTLMVAFAPIEGWMEFERIDSWLLSGVATE